MKEDVLQYIWKTQSMQKSPLRTTGGTVLQILTQGNQNTNAGPDFASAKIKLDDVLWVGDVEIHTKSSFWNTHKHHLDVAYNKVVLHVVWEHDAEVRRKDGSKIPTLELKTIVNDIWLQRYRMLASSFQTIPCQNFIGDIDEIYLYDSFNKCLINRLERKSEKVLEHLKFSAGDWESTAYFLLFESFGFKKNAEGFRQLSSRVDFALIRKLNSLQEVEAYLFAMAGLLPKGDNNDYSAKLHETFTWLKRKYNIKKPPMSSNWWLFMRMRPANFPTLRIAQLASFLFVHKNFFRELLESNPQQVVDFFMILHEEFWQSHYHFNKKSSQKTRGIGKQSATLLGINVAAVLLMAYGKHNNNNHFSDRAITFLENLKMENNAITRKWESLGVTLNNAAESQGAIELFNNYCKKGGCLSCSIGHKILHSA